MDEKNSKGMVGGNIPESSPTTDSDYTERKESNYFLSNGKRHIIHSPKKIIALVTTILALPVVGIFIAGYRSAKFGYSEVDSRVLEKAASAPVGEKDRTSIRERLDEHSTAIIIINEKLKRVDKIESDVLDLQGFANPRKRKP